MRDLAAAIMHLAPAHIVADYAPDTFAGILSHPGIVWSGGSDATIYGAREVNWAFRAWHDQHHAAGMHDFTLAGEARAVVSQIAHLREAFPRCPAHWADTLLCEVIGQGLHLAETGDFPVDQKAWFNRAIACPAFMSRVHSFAAQSQRNMRYV